jgi:hypothetical protein
MYIPTNRSMGTSDKRTQYNWRTYKETRQPITNRGMTDQPGLNHEVDANDAGTARCGQVLKMQFNFNELN